MEFKKGQKYYNRDSPDRILTVDTIDEEKREVWWNVGTWSSFNQIRSGYVLFEDVCEQLPKIWN